jgi:hypothetical protein
MRLINWLKQRKNVSAGVNQIDYTDAIRGLADWQADIERLIEVNKLSAGRAEGYVYKWKPYLEKIMLAMDKAETPQGNGQELAQVGTISEVGQETGYSGLF